jgi:hypothetical protein
VSKLASFLKDKKSVVALDVTTAGLKTAVSKTIVLNKQKIKIKEGKSTEAKEDYSTAVGVELDPVDPNKFKFKMSASRPVESFRVQPGLRDLYVLIIRLLNMTALQKDVVKFESESAIRDQIWVSNSAKTSSATQDSRALLQLHFNRRLITLITRITLMTLTTLIGAFQSATSRPTCLRASASKSSAPFWSRPQSS